MNKAFGSLFSLISFVWLLLVLLVQPVGATQVHVGDEGHVAHQIAHLFFAIAMGILSYWLRQRGLVKERGWRLVRYGAFFFILWNMNAVLAHYLEERDDVFRLINSGIWHARVALNESTSRMALVYYLVKMDHLLCVPAIIFLYEGLRQLLSQAQENRQNGGNK